MIKCYVNMSRPGILLIDTENPGVVMCKNEPTQHEDYAWTVSTDQPLFVKISFLL